MSWADIKALNKLVQQNVVVLSTFQKCCSVTFLRALC
jgi:hypothetical protein